MLSVKAFVFAVLCAGVWCQQYATHTPPQVVATQTYTVTDTTTVTHTLRVTQTSDIWVTDYTTYTATATQYITFWNYQPGNLRTYTSVIRVTSTPIAIVTATECINSALTETSIFTSFITSTSTVDLVQSITHIAVAHQVHTVPVVSTQMLHQSIITTVTRILTTTVTSTTLYGQ